MKKLTLPILLIVLSLTLAYCGEEDPVAEEDDSIGGKADASVEAVFLNFSFDGEAIIDSSWGIEEKIEEQLLYTVGQLNGDNSVSRMDRVEITNMTTTELEDGIYQVNYHAVVPVAWNRDNDLVETYVFQLPLRVGYSGLQAFTEKYSHSCVDAHAHDVTSGVMWYYYRPARYGCELDEMDIIEVTATVSESSIGTTGRYPEYHKVWEDDELRVAAIFGKYEDDATSGDAGINAYNEFLRYIARELEDHDLVTTPEEIPSNPGVDLPDVTYEATLDDGRKVTVVALLVDNVQSAGREFDQRYEDLSESADLIVYNGHSGLGANIRALATKGSWVQGQYAIVFMNGCDTYAYVDSALADAHAAVNPDAVTGTEYVDIIMNAMPAYFHSFAEATMTLVQGLMSYEEPRTYEYILGGIASRHVVLVSGEGDNVYVPGYDPDGSEDPDDPPPPPPETWEGMNESGTVASSEEVRFQTTELAVGRYVFEMTGSGDADLYVRIGEEPTDNLYDCRPYRGNSNETCIADVPSPAVVHIMVQGYSASSTFELKGSAE